MTRARATIAGPGSAHGLLDRCSASRTRCLQALWAAFPNAKRAPRGRPPRSLGHCFGNGPCVLLRQGPTVRPRTDALLRTASGLDASPNLRRNPRESAAAGRPERLVAALGAPDDEGAGEVHFTDWHHRQRALVAASLIAVPDTKSPTHRRWACPPRNDESRRGAGRLLQARAQPAPLAHARRREQQRRLAPRRTSRAVWPLRRRHITSSSTSITGIRATRGPISGATVMASDHLER